MLLFCGSSQGLLVLTNRMCRAGVFDSLIQTDAEGMFCNKNLQESEKLLVLEALLRLLNVELASVKNLALAIKASGFS